MANEKMKFILMIVAGVALALVSIYGYQLGIARSESFGAFQLGGTLVGIGLAVYGVLKVGKKG